MSPSEAVLYMLGLGKLQGKWQNVLLLIVAGKIGSFLTALQERMKSCGIGVQWGGLSLCNIYTVYIYIHTLESFP